LVGISLISFHAFRAFWVAADEASKVLWNNSPGRAFSRRRSASAVRSLPTSAMATRSL